ncbi:MAG: septum formation initiator family protein [Geminicoccaceae bacterium]|nr:septum formation initiator family protein [Geminicoccaceae bacterium]
MSRFGPVAAATAAVKRHWPSLLAVLLLIYFAVQAVRGERGLWAWFALRGELARARDELAELRAERARLEARKAALSPERIDPDLLEEELRRAGYLGEREFLLLLPRRGGQ